MKKEITYFLVLVTMLLMSSCTKSPETLSQGSTDMRLRFLKNIGRNIILPEYAKLKVNTDSLLIATRRFNNFTNETNLISLQNSWDQAYSQYMRCNAFNFGPGRDALDKELVNQIGLFPVSIAQIEKKISDANYTSNDFARDTRGFLVLDYLLFDSIQNNSSTITRYSDTKRKIFTDSVVCHLKKTIDKLNLDWSSYITVFENDQSTAASSNIASFYNEFVANYELAKNYKVQQPAGLRADQTSTVVKSLEAYYSGKSLKYFKLHLQHLNDIWEGNGQDPLNTTGFDDYLNDIPGGNQLVADTRNSWNEIQLALENIPDNQTLEYNINNNIESVKTLYTKLSNHTKFYKSELSSKIGIDITYSSGDND